MEQGHYGHYTGNSRASRLKNDMIHERELIHDAKNQIHNEDKKYHSAGMQKYDAVAKNSKAYIAGMENGMGGLKQSKSQTDTFGPGGSDANPEIYSAIVSAAKMDDQFLSPVDGSDQNLANSEEATNDSMLMQEDGYGMSAAKMSALKGRYMHHKK
tara:strand:+ start:394 stop:861 length:468 start_codon:yes stop_codon:yes gene_type:complete